MSQRCTVLLVDDSADLLEVVRTFLEEDGHIVFTASNGREALDVLASMPRRPCVILLDMMMPVMDGSAVLRALKADDGVIASIPVIIVSATAKRVDGSACVLSKPISMESMLQTVVAHCRGTCKTSG